MTDEQVIYNLIDFMLKEDKNIFLSIDAGVLTERWRWYDKSNWRWIISFNKNMREEIRIDERDVDITSPFFDKIRAHSGIEYCKTRMYIKRWAIRQIDIKKNIKLSF